MLNYKNMIAVAQGKMYRYFALLQNGVTLLRYFLILKIVCLVYENFEQCKYFGVGLCVHKLFLFI